MLRFAGASEAREGKMLQGIPIIGSWMVRVSGEVKPVMRIISLI
jgi:hypothetical protein